MTTMTDTARRVAAGVDTHRDQHVVAALDERGAELGVRPFPTTQAGHRALLAWLQELGAVERVGVEGTGSYGAGLARFLHAEGVTVVRPNRSEFGPGDKRLRNGPRTAINHQRPRRPPGDAAGQHRFVTRRPRREPPGSHCVSSPGAYSASRRSACPAMGETIRAHLAACLVPHGTG